jgi:hypothetical protein
MGSPSLRAGLALAAMLALAAGVWHSTQSREPPHAGSTQRAAMVPGEAPSAPQTEGAAPRPDDAAVPSPGSFATRFQDAGNYSQFIESALPAAKGGDAEAQNYIAAALQYCDETYRLYFKRRDKVLSVDDAIATWTSRSDYRQVENLKVAEAHCGDVYGRVDPAWGSATEWLARAAQAGQPVALFRKGTQIWMDMESNRAPTYSRPDGTPYTLDEARAMVRAAARSANPEVLFEVGDMTLLLKPDSDHEDNRDTWTWRYVACLRGLDCRAEANWHRQFCTWDPDCRPDEPGMDYLRRVALQNGIYDLELRASQVNERIDARDWVALELAD